MKRIAIMTSGGDSPGMNAGIRAVVRGAIYNGMEVYGIRRAFEGLIEGDIYGMEVSSVSDIIHRGGTMLRTSRSPHFMKSEGFKRALDMLENFEIEGLIVIGGDGSLRGALALAEAGIPVVGLPATIDNDLGFTDFSIGFDTAVNTVLSAISNIRDTSSSHERTTIIEVMGRDCGAIALYAGLTGGAESILVPEVEVDINAVCRKLIEGKNRGKIHSIILRAEGVSISSNDLADKIIERTGLDTKCVVLGYVQRGGTPTARDRMIASRMGYRALELLREGTLNRAVGIRGTEIIDYDLAEVLKIKHPLDRYMLELADILSI